MIYKFLSLLFFCGACISAFGQELQAPQINQNAIFANPGLAGSKGCMRIGSTFGIANQYSLSLQGISFDKRYLFNTNDHNRFYNCLISADDLVFKNKLGVAAYVKSDFIQQPKSYSIYDNNSKSIVFTNPKLDYYTFLNVRAGFMLAPKFRIVPKNIKKESFTLSPALAIGLVEQQVNYYARTAIYYINDNNDTIHLHDTQSNHLNLDYFSLGLLYSNTTSYMGLKFNFNYLNKHLFLNNINLVVAHSFFNKQATNPAFSFNPQLYVSLPLHVLNNKNVYQIENPINSIACLNLDVRYEKFILGSFANWTYAAFTNKTVHFKYDPQAKNGVDTNYTYSKPSFPNGFYVGITGGIQLENMRIVVNYAPKFSSKTTAPNGLSISANFYLKNKIRTSKK